MSTTTGLAGDAFEAFKSGNHQQCGKCLEQILGQKTGGADVKAAHNAAVNAYYNSSCSDPQDLLSKLSTQYDRAREQDKKDKGKRKKEEDEEDAMRDDDDLYVLRYNQALLCVQLRHYAQARHILEELFDNIEPIDDFLAIKICFLLLELCLLQREPEQGVPVLQVLEKPNAFHSLLKPERPSAKSLEAPQMDEEEEGEDGHLRDEDGEPKEDLEATVAEHVDIPKPEKQEIHGPLPSLVFGAFLTRHGRAPDTISPAEFKFNCFVYRLRIHIALRSMSAAKKDAKKAMELWEQLQGVPILWPHKLNEAEDMQEDPVRQVFTSHEKAKVHMLKAYLEYAKGNFRKALKLMSLCRFNFAAAGIPMEIGRAAHKDDDVEDHIPTDFHPAQDDACSPLFFNNMGCVHFMMHKPNLAAYYFSKALAKSIAPAQSKGAAGDPGRDVLLSARTGLDEPGFAATKHWLDKRSEITFNVGLQFLLTGRSAQASKCFEQCVPVFRNWPRLWIRIAECCIELRQSNKAGDKSKEAQPTGPASQTFQSWNRSKTAPGLVPSGSSLCDSLGPTALGSGISKLACGAQGFGILRRVLMMVDKMSMVGKMGGEDVERTGPAGAAPAPPGRSDDVVTDPLIAAAMCLKNVLILVEPTLRAADADGGSRQASGNSKPGPNDTAEIEANLLEDAALLKLSWISLCQRDHVPALRYSKRLLEKNNLLIPSSGDNTSRMTPEAGLEDLKKSWTFQVQNLPYSKDKQTVQSKFPSSMGSIASAVSYAAEALLMGGRAVEARQLMSTFGEKSLGKGLHLQAQHVQDQEKSAPHSVPVLERMDKKEEGLFEGCPAQACGGGLPPTASMGGLTPPGYSICCAAATHQPHQGRDRDAKGETERDKGKDGAFAVLVNYENASFPPLGDMQCTMFTNLAGVYAQDGAFEEAQRACEKALQIQPKALLPLRTLAYLYVRKGMPGEAMKRLKEGQPRK